MAEASKLYSPLINQALLPQAPVGTSAAFYGSAARTSVLPVATGQLATATAGTAIALYAIKKNISVLR